MKKTYSDASMVRVRTASGSRRHERSRMSEYLSIPGFGYLDKPSKADVLSAVAGSALCVASIEAFLIGGSCLM